METDLFLTPQQLYELRRVRQWAADFRINQRIKRFERSLLKAQDYIDQCIREDC